MKTGEVATVIGVSPRTITSWTEQPELQRFFSEGARMDAEGSRTREYTPQDVLVLNTIHKRKTRRNSWDDVARILDTGERVELEASNMLNQAMISPMEHMNQLAMVTKERDLIARELELANDEIDRLREVNDHLQRKIVEARSEERTSLRDEMKELQDTIIELNRQIAVLQYKLQEDRNED